MLTFAAPLAPAADTNLSTIPTAVCNSARDACARQVIGGPTRRAAPAAPFPWKRALLWAMLALCVCLLAWMAYRLTKEMGEKNNAPR